MNSINKEPHEVDLAPLRAALEAMPAPPVDDAALRRMFREQRHAHVESERAAARTRKYWALAAAVSSVAVGGLVALVLMTERRAAEPPVPTLGVAPATVAAFQPLGYSSEVVAGAAYSVVRVRIPLSSLALMPDAAADGMIEADLLVGEDGLARGIRFNGPGALLVSKTSQ
ncbi:MAG: hypothetical protein ABI640_03630 [Gammaproteobacteria bacterium]